MTVTATSSLKRSVRSKRRRELRTHRAMSQLECDSKGWALGLAYGMSEKKRRQYLTKTSSRRVGRRASWLRGAAMLRMLHGVGKIDAGVAI